MSGPDHGSTLPRLALLFDEDSVPPLAFAAAANGQWHTIWVCPAGTRADTIRLLARLGTVLVGEFGEPSGLDELAARLAAHQASGVLTFEDSHLRAAAALADRLGLAGPSAEAVMALTNKAEQRRALSRGGLVTPVFRELPAPYEGLAEIAAGMAYPTVLKPQQSVGSRHTYLLRSEADLVAAVAEVRARSVTPPDLLLEGFLPDASEATPSRLGGYLSVETVLGAGSRTHLAVSGRLPLAEPFRESGTVLPAPLPDDVRAAVLSLVDASLDALDIRVGCVHTEVKLTDDGPRVIEVNGRLGGGGIPALLESVYGVSAYRLAAQAALGRSASIPVPQPHGVGFFVAIQPPTSARGVTAIHGLDTMADHPDIAEVRVNRPPGSVLDWRANGSYDYVCSLRGLVADHVAMFALLDLIDATVDVDYR